MGPVTKRVVLATVLLSLVAAYGQAQPLPGDWPSRYRHAANTVNTPVRLSNGLNVLWEAPAPGGQAAYVYVTQSLQQVVISGNCVYDALSGVLVHDFPDAGNRSAITTTVLLNGALVDVVLTCDSYECRELFAYTLHDGELLWSLKTVWLDPDGLHIRRLVELNAKDGVFYIAGDNFGPAGVAAVNAYTGAVLWETWDTDEQIPLDADGIVLVDGVAVARIGDTDMVFMALSSGGLVALTAADGNYSWHAPCDTTDAAPLCVDEAAGVVYMSTRREYSLHAYSATPGGADPGVLVERQPLAGWPVPLDHILNGAPTLGWAQNSAIETPPIVPAVFAVTGGVNEYAGVFAYSRPGGELLWVTSIPSSAYKSAVYSGDATGGKLYIGANNGFTYVLDAFTGDSLQILATDFGYSPGQRCPAIVDVDVDVDVDGVSVGVGVMYFVNNAGTVAAWSPLDGDPRPRVFHFLISPAADQISINSDTEVTARLTDGDLVPIFEAAVTFSSDAASKQGYLAPTTVPTDENGLATTTFFSQNRTGIITVTASAAGALSATTQILVAKGGGEEPPPTETGSIQGTVYYLGKPARKLEVSLGIFEGAVFATTTTNPKGKYSFDGVFPGDYEVSAIKEGLTATSPLVTMPSPPDVISGVDLLLVAAAP